MPLRDPLRAVLALALALAATPAPAADEAAPPARRVVAMNPSISETLVALDARGSLVGVDDYSAQLQPELRDLPTVGGLFNPSLESIVALEPDLVALVPSAEQRGLLRRLEQLAIPVLVLPNISLEEAIDSIEILGERVGRGAAARERTGAIRRSLASARAAGPARSPRTVLVLQREPLYLVGGGSWIDALLEAAGAENLGAALEGAYPRVSVEWLLDAAPEVILDATENGGDPARFWSRWPSLPAVAGGRVRRLSGDVIRPGPYLDRSLEGLVAALRGPFAPGERP